jgi:hypothetical protein
MKTSGLLLFSSALFCLIYLTSCIGFHTIDGNGNITTENRTLNTFSKVKSEGSFEVYISQDSVQSVTVEAESNLLPYIETDVSGSVLLIRIREHRNIDNHEPIKIYVKSPMVEGIDLSGSGLISCDSMITPNMDLHLSGSGKMNVIATTNKIDAHISGSGGITISGSSNESDFNIDGSGNIHAYDLKQDTCYADISGSGDMYLNVNKFLDVKISGSGKVHYIGNPSVNTFITGSGAVIHE